MNFLYFQACSDSRFSFIPIIHSFSCTFQSCLYAVGPITVLYYGFQLSDPTYMPQSTSLSEIITSTNILEMQRREDGEKKLSFITKVKNPFPLMTPAFQTAFLYARDNLTWDLLPDQAQLHTLEQETHNEKYIRHNNKILQHAMPNGDGYPSNHPHN